MDHLSPSDRGNVVPLMEQCPVCGAVVASSAARCDACLTERPAEGWSHEEPEMSERTPEPAMVAPRPAPPTLRPVAPAPKSPSLSSFYVRFFSVFAGSAIASAAAVVLIGLPLLPELHAAQAAPTTVVAPSAALITPPPDVHRLDAVEAHEGAPEPVAVEAEPVVPAPVARPGLAPAPVLAPAPARVASRPEPRVEVAAVEPVPVEVEPDTEAPVVAPVPVAPPAPVVPAAAARASGVYLGRIGRDPVSMNLTFHANQSVSATLRVAERGSTEVIETSGTYSIAADDSIDFALSYRGAAGVVGYSGNIVGAHATGIVTEDGRRRGRFEVER